MSALGYNTVRVFLNDRRIGGDLTTPGLDPAYMANLLDFLELATRVRVYVVLTPGYYHPNNYDTIEGGVPPTPDSDNVNNVILSAGYVKAWAVYVGDVLRAIRSHSPSVLSTVFSVDIRNESFVVDNYRPFSLSAGVVTLGDGGRCDMSSAVDRQTAIDNNTVSSTNVVVAEIKAVDPEVLATASIFPPLAVGRTGYDGAAPHPEDSRVPLRPSALETTDIDYIDVHPYPTGPGNGLAELLQSCELGPLSPGSKPRVFGEFGAFKDIYPTLEGAVRAMRDLQVESCQLLGFGGWLLWTWDSPDQEQAQLWTALDGLNSALGPGVRQDACQP